jgi:hypothetical protein
VTRQIQEIALQAGADTFLGEFAFGALEHFESDELTPSLYGSDHTGTEKVRSRRVELPRAEAQVSG